MESHIKTIVRTSRQLAGIGAPMSHAQLISTLLSSFGNRFIGKVDAFKTHKLATLTVSDITNAMKIAELEEQDKHAAEVLLTAQMRAAMLNLRAPSSQRRLTCLNCMKDGHKKWDCREPKVSADQLEENKKKLFGSRYKTPRKEKKIWKSKRNGNWLI